MSGTAPPSLLLAAARVLIPSEARLHLLGEGSGLFVVPLLYYLSPSPPLVSLFPDIRECYCVLIAN